MKFRAVDEGPLKLESEPANMFPICFNFCENISICKIRAFKITKCQWQTANQGLKKIILQIIYSSKALDHGINIQ